MSLLLKFAPWIAAVLVVFGAGAWSGHKLAQPAYNRLQGEFKVYQGEVSRNAIAAQKAATDALQAQIDARQKQDEVNAHALADLQTQNASIAADRDHTLALVHRLLNPPAAAVPGGAQVPQAGDQPGTAAAGGTSVDGPIAGLLADAHDECERNANRLNSLIAQIKPQM